MDEGLEPHELAERAVEHHQHAALHGGGRGGVIAPAVASAVLAVLAALGSLLSGDAANEALLQQLKASDTWSYYQATRLKDHVYDVSGQMLRALGAAQATGTTPAKHVADSFLRKTRRYVAEENTLQSEARRAEAESRLHLSKHRHFAFGVLPSGHRTGVDHDTGALQVASRDEYACWRRWHRFHGAGDPRLAGSAPRRAPSCRNSATYCERGYAFRAT